jgi:hypothetical protein
LNASEELPVDIKAILADVEQATLGVPVTDGKEPACEK